MENSKCFKMLKINIDVCSVCKNDLKSVFKEKSRAIKELLFILNIFVIDILPLHFFFNKGYLQYKSIYS